MLEIILFVALLLVMLIVGVLAGRRATNEGYQIYGGKLPSVGFIASYVATFVGAGFFVAGTAYAYQFGKAFIWYAIGMVIGITVFGFFSRWLKNYSKGKEFYNMPDFFKHRFGIVAGKVVALMLILLMAGDLAIQLISGGKILELLGIAPYNIAVVITITVVAIYLLSSGFRAVVWTDVVLAVLMGVLTLLISYISITNIPTINLNFEAVPIGTIIGFFLFGVFGPYTLSTYYQRIFAAKNAKTAMRGTWFGGLFIFILVALVIVIGIAARSIMPNIDPDIAFVSLLQHFGGLIMSVGALVLWSALMSTSDTLTFSGSQILSYNVFGVKMSKKAIRISVIAILLFGMIISFLVPSIIAVGMIFLGGGTIIAPIGFFQWFIKFKQKAVVSALVAGTIALIAYVALVDLTPAVVAVTFVVSTVTLFAVHLGEKVVRGVRG